MPSLFTSAAVTATLGLLFVSCSGSEWRVGAGVAKAKQQQQQQQQQRKGLPSGKSAAAKKLASKKHKRHASGHALVQPRHHPARPFSGCTTDLHCSLNGVCDAASKTCVCDAEWVGPACGQLNLVDPVAMVPAYPPPALFNSTTSWGGSVLNVSGKYHMYLAEFSNNCGLLTWTTNSIIRHAVADSPEGPFEPKEVIMEPFAHNPTAIQAPDGTYLIYHIGCGTPNKGMLPCTDCSGGESGSTCKHPGEEVACNGNTTNILFSDSPDGPWEQFNAPFVKSKTMGTPYQIDNPTVVFYPNGSLLMLGRGGQSAHGQSQTDGFITADHWRGPYIMHRAVGDATSPAVEDPFVWRDRRGNYHALFHKFTDEHPGCGGHAFSTDGVHWVLPQDDAYTTQVNTTSGTVYTAWRRERPHLLFDEAGTTPQVLYTSMWLDPPPHDKTFTYAQRIGH